jgi:translation initiation factor 1
MNVTCQICGLPKELCVCETIAKSDQKVEIKTEKRKFGKPATVITGLDPKSINIKEVAKNLKSHLACGGTIKKDVIELQGEHINKVKAELIKLGFSEDSIIIKWGK